MNTEDGYSEAACGHLAAALVLAADDELTTAEWRAVNHHLARCAACRSQWAAAARLDMRLRECGVEVKSQNPPDPAVRVRLVDALRAHDRRRWKGGWPRKGRWGSAVAYAATLCVAAMAAWIVLVPENLGRRRVERPVIVQGNAELIRVKVSLAPVGDPFLDGSLAESMVLTDVAVGSDGQPRDIRLAE
jgi:anti-sigma factor RsiW